jgi:hypothetical protein
MHYITTNKLIWVMSQQNHPYTHKYFFAVAPNMVGQQENENSAADVRVSFEIFHPQCWCHRESWNHRVHWYNLF